MTEYKSAHARMMDVITDPNLFSLRDQLVIAQALSKGLHPQQRTSAFHMFYGEPIRKEKCDREMSHMTDERQAFRLGFILEEFKEILLGGFGIEMKCRFTIPNEGDHRSPGWNLEGTTPSLLRAVESSTKRDLVEVVDGLGDLNAVVNGYALELGVNMDAVDREIAASNFTKMGEDGKPIIGDGVTGPVGKVLKGPNFMKPQIEWLLQFDDSQKEES